ncbi:hypothetical protein [Paraburkholderia sp. JHI869]|uniref:hypothetical protein n=1 Tax=Paraburkholderia sp. JHI869 TaxID=3112959 RepID=UPI00317314CF
MDTLKFALALEGEGMNPKHAGIIAHELYALYAHSVLGGKYKEVDYGDFDELSAKARKVREDSQARNDKLSTMLNEIHQEQQQREADKAEDQANRESIRETTRFLTCRLALSNETARLDFVLANGLPMERDGQFRYRGWAHLGWFRTQREAIDAAVKYPKEDE